MNLKRIVLILFVCLCIFRIEAIEYIWTAAGDGVSLYQEKNWAYNGQNPGQIDPGVPITFDLLVNSGTVGGGGFNGDLLLGGHQLMITGGQVVGQNNSGIMSFSPSNGVKGSVVMSGGILRCFFLHEIELELRNNASVELLGLSDVLNGSNLQLAADYSGSIVLKQINRETVRQDYLSMVTIGGEAAVENQNIFLSIIDGGTRITLVEVEDVLPIANKDYSDSPIPNEGPNIIFILLDDMGYGDLGKFWQNQRQGDNKMLSPVLDKLADEGAMMEHHYCAAPVCAPSRASLLEGLHQGHASVRNNQFDKELKEGLGMAEMLRKAGYRTMHVGKYGLAGGRNSELDGHPLRRGFDQFFGYLFHTQGHTHYPQDGTTSKQAYFTDGSTALMEGTMLTYTTDVFTAKSKQWIIDHQSKRPEQPFFLFLAYDVPHFALDVPTMAYPEGRGVDGGLQWTGADSETPWVNTAKGERNAYIHPDYLNKDWPDNEKKFATMMRRVDNACEDLVQTLKDLNIDEHTMIVFTSDNGPHVEGGRDVTFFQSYAFMNGIKRDMWEGGIRMATLARYPGMIPARSVHTFPSGHWDWMATFAELAGVAQPAYTDGVSLMPSLMLEKGQQTKGYLYHEYYQNGSTPNYADFGSSKQGRQRNEMQVMRIGDLKGVRYDVTDSQDDFEIYNVATDPFESTNLASEMPMLQQEMKDKVLQVRRVDASAQRPYDDVPVPGLSIENLPPGVHKKIYEGKQMWVPDFELLPAVDSSVVAGIDVSTAGRDSLFGMFFKTYLQIETTGVYTFYLQSSSPCHVKLHAIHLLDNDFTFTNEEMSASLHLAKGLHPLRVYYQQNTTVESQLDLKLSGPGLEKQTIPEDMFFQFQESSTGIEESIGEEDLSLFPQPAKDFLNVRISGNEAADFQVSVYNAAGRRMRDFNKRLVVANGGARIVLPLRDLSAGLYVLELTDQKTGNAKFKKFVISECE